MVHFTRNKKRILKAEANTPLVIKDQRIHASQEVKILGVLLDSELRYSSAIARLCKQGINAVLALKQLKNPRPKATRQLYTSTVAPFVDYASVIWAPNATKSALSRLDAIQKIAAPAIIEGFRTVALHTAESEANLQSV